VQVIQAGLSVAIDVSYNTTENLRIVCRMRATLCVKILKLDLLAAEVLREATKLAATIFVTFLVVEGVCS